MHGLQLSRLTLPRQYELTGPHKLQDELDTATLMIALKINGTGARTTPPKCKSILYLLHNLFRRDVIPKEIETLKDVRRFIAQKIREASFTGDDDDITIKYKEGLPPYEFLPDNFKPMFNQTLERQLAKIQNGLNAAKHPETLRDIRDVFRVGSSPSERTRLLTRQQGFDTDVNYFGMRALAIVDTLKAQIEENKSKDNVRFASCLQDNFDASRVTSHCKIGYYENEKGCCEGFPNEIQFSTNAPGTGAYDEDVKFFERQFLNLTYEGYSVQEAVLISNILAFLQNEMFSTIRKILNYETRFRVNPLRQAYGNLDCDTPWQKTTKRLNRGNKAKTVAGALVDATKLTTGAVFYTTKAAMIGTGNLVTGLYNKIMSGAVRGIKLETQGDLLAAALICNISLMFKVALSIYDEFVRLIIQQIIKLNYLGGYTYDSTVDDGSALKEYLKTAIPSERQRMTVAKFIKLRVGDHSYEDFETEMHAVLGTLGETISAAFETIPGLSALSKLIVTKVTDFIQKTCVQATLALHYSNTVEAWLSDCNIEFHLKQIAPLIKWKYPDVYRKLFNITNDDEWARLVADSKNLSIQNRKTDAPVAATVEQATPTIGEGLLASLTPVQPVIKLSDFVSGRPGGYKKYRARRSRSASKSNSKSKRKHSRSVKRRSGSKNRKKSQAYRK